MPTEVVLLFCEDHSLQMRQSHFLITEFNKCEFILTGNFENVPKQNQIQKSVNHGLKCCTRK